MILQLLTIALESMLRDARTDSHPILIAPEITRTTIPTKQSSSNKEMKIEKQRESVLLIPTVTAKLLQKSSAKDPMMLHLV